ncbi:MAG TPA: hypothetical protein VFR61_01145 [Nitrososphaeraceae archaeon]|nr:hypothetical protein [Nitrososphaeraceae archaeon]
MNQKGILDHDTFLGLIQSLNSFADNFKNSNFSGTTLFLPYKYKTDYIRPSLQKER